MIGQQTNSHRVPERWTESKKDMEGAIVVESQRRTSRKIKKVRVKEDIKENKVVTYLL